MKIEDWKQSIKDSTVDYWLHEQLFQLANPLIKANESWITVGDGYGFDANYFAQKVVNTFKGINNAYWKPILDTEIANEKSIAFKKNLSKQRRDNFLCKLGILPHQVLCAVIFKTLPDNETIQKLKSDGYLYYEFPKNPYL